MKDTDFYNFIQLIIDEHFKITKNTNSNLNYLWYMYRNGMNKNEYKPFILMAEMNLLKEMGYMSEDEVNNLGGMIGSKDEDNLTIAYMAIKSFRDQRVKDHGEYSSYNTFPYTSVESNYSDNVLSTKLFTQVKDVA